MHGSLIYLTVLMSDALMCQWPVSTEIAYIRIELGVVELCVEVARFEEGKLPMLLAVERVIYIYPVIVRERSTGLRCFENHPHITAL